MRFITNIPSGGGGGGVGPPGPPGPPGPAGPSSLQAAYDGGNTILMDDAGGEISFTSDAGSTLSLLSLVTDATASGAGLFLNNEGTGNGIQIQDNGVDVFFIDADGAINLNANNDGTDGSKIAMVAGAGVTGDGGGVTIDAGIGGSAGDGGQVDIQSGRASVAGQVSGEIRILGAVQLFATGAAAFITIRGGERTHAGSAISAGAVNILGGDTAGAGASAGAVNITGGTASSTAAGGDVVITGGTSVGGAQGGVSVISSRVVADGGAVLTITQDAVPAGFFAGVDDPGGGAGVVAVTGSLFLRNAGVGGALYVKTGPLDNDWSVVSTGGAGTTLQDAYDAGTGEIFLTNANGAILLDLEEAGINALDIFVTAPADGDGISVVQEGPGDALIIDNTGGGDALSVFNNTIEIVRVSGLGAVTVVGGNNGIIGSNLLLAAGAGVAGAGGATGLSAGAGVGGNGGNLSASGGGGPAGFNGGQANWLGGFVTGAGSVGGATTVSGGQASGGAAGGILVARGGPVTAGAGAGGAATFSGGSITTTGTGIGGAATLQGGDTIAGAGAAGALTVRGGDTLSTTNVGGGVTLRGGNSAASSGAGGGVSIIGGTSSTGLPGSTTISTSRSATAGAVATDGPVLTLSQTGTSGASVDVFAGTIDPSSGSGVVANEGSLYLRDAGTAGSAYLKTGATNTAWTLLATGSAAPLNNLTATVAPTSANDSTQGYSIGSLWMDDEGGSAGTVGNGVWIARSVAVGLADWRRIEALNQTAGTAAPTSNEDANDGYSVGSIWIWPNFGAWVATNVSTGGLATWVPIVLIEPASRVVSGTTDTTLAADIGNVVFVSQAAGCTVTLNDLSASLITGRMLLLTWQCEGAATILTIDPGAGVSIDGSTSNYVATTGRSRVSLMSRDGLAWFSGTP